MKTGCPYGFVRIFFSFFPPSLSAFLHYSKMVQDIIRLYCVCLGSRGTTFFLKKFFTSAFFFPRWPLHIFSQIFDSSYVLSCGHDFKLAD